MTTETKNTGQNNERLTEIMEKARAASVPECASIYEGHDIRLLVSLCREMQAASDNGTFFISVSTAARLLEIDSLQAWKYFAVLRVSRIVEVVTPGDKRRHRATVYRYIGD